MEKIEILAPAGSMESLFAAINKGADAVYLGGNKFSARAYASNFDNDNMMKAVDYAHSYGVKIYVTLNTILKEDEVEEAIKYVGYLYEIGVDALIIQDLGLFNRIRQIYPKLELHASTQMTVHNGEAAIYFRDKGFSRIVLSREMTLDEIKYISKELSIETEIFVHGAICISYSGQCLMSSVIGGRSGNRGRCAQPCRMEYTLEGEKGSKKKGYLLSPKDMCTIEDIDDIIKTGTSSLKIEGRMKRAEYVAGVVDNYRKAVDKYISNKSYNVNTGKRELLQLFNRSGFTNAYLKKDTGRDMMSYNSPKNSGIPLGKVDSNGEVMLMENLSLGDGIRYGDKGFTLSKIIVNGKEKQEARIGEKAKLFPIEYKKGEQLFKSLNKELFETLDSYKEPYYKKIKLNASITFKVNEPMILKVVVDGVNYEFSGEIVQKAEKRPLERERIVEAIKKSGDIPYQIDIVEFEEFEDGFLRIADLNNLRREALEGIVKSICKKHRRVRPIKREIDNAKGKSIKNKEVSSYIYSCITKEQLNALIEMNADTIAIDIFSREKGALRKEDIYELYKKHSTSINIYLKTSSIIKGEFNKVVKSIDELKPYIKGIITSNIGIVNLYKDSLNIIGDYKLNIMNSSSLEFYQEEIVVPTLSLELNRGEIKSIARNNKGQKAVVIYGKPELMVSEYCPIGSTFGGKTSSSSCNVACMTDKFTLVDRVKERSRVMTDLYCRSYILNSKAINITDEVDNLKDMGITHFRFDFRDEQYDEVKNIILAFRSNKELESSKFTKGHYRRGIE